MARSDTSALYAFDRAMESGRTVRVVGVDEAGRGPLAGPVVAAAVVLDLDRQIDGINDSKKLSPKKREELYGLITANAAWAVGMASHEEIDSINILRASLLAMQRALSGLAQPAASEAPSAASAWSLALIDGNVPVPGLDASRQQTVVRGDAQSASIAAASIIAKVTRDRLMIGYHDQYPGYEFAAHKGYPTPLHCDRIRRMGLCGIHRKTFCEAIVSQTSLDLPREKTWQK
jgi:ribonuclease HII